MIYAQVNAKNTQLAANNTLFIYRVLLALS